VLAVIAIIGYVIGRQLMGEPLRGKRVVLLPVILAVIGAIDLGTHGHHVEPADVVCLVISGLIAVTIGLQQGRMLRLESRNGALWGQMPVRGLWLWVVLVGSRLIMTVIALAIGAKVAGSSAPITMLLGINRLGQAAIVMRHALATGIPFAPEKDGRSFLSGNPGDAASRLPGRTDGYPETDPVRGSQPGRPPASDTKAHNAAGQPGTRGPTWPPANGGPHSAATAVLEMLARLADEWLARRQRGR
jgi:hypothetical protein